MKRAYFQTAKIAWKFWDDLVEMQHAGKIAGVAIYGQPKGFKIQWVSK
jgi:hypothetical protein